MLSLDEPLNLKITSGHDRTVRTSICAPLQFARARISRASHKSSPDAADKDMSDSSSSTVVDLSLSPSSSPSPPSPIYSRSSWSPATSLLATESESTSYIEDSASPPLGFQFFLPIGGEGPLRLPSSMLIGQHSPEPSGDEQLACRWLKCHLLFDSLQELVDHVNDSHVKPEKNTGYCCHWEGCARKGRGFNARYKMLIHIRTHTNEKPHHCPTCHKSFSRLENLKIHTRSHTGEKPYICPYEGCNKRYSNSSDRFKHTRTHYVDKPYCCKMVGCLKRYTDPSSLRKHIKAHGHTVAQDRATLPRVEGLLRGSRLDAESIAPVYGRGIDVPYPGGAHFVLPGAATSLLGAHALHNLARPIGGHPLDLSMLSPLLGARPVLYPSSGALGLGKVPILYPLLLPLLGLGAGRGEKGVEEEEDVDDDDDEGRVGAGLSSHSWVVIPPGMLFLKQVVST
ncbi:zinc finger protein GLIS2-like [Myxocyprinus asiaticus]|uniref:zinc finger protein GLIS2-like n=1 Tax=Myxocyprinus asiaticus TaxID=70543 RepID=UPI0022236632|nr:zinc finger protein GLIS2-like [Myxocyprinus asiaticus]